MQQQQAVMDEFIEDRQKEVTDMKERHHREMEALQNNNSADTSSGLLAESPHLTNGHGTELEELREQYEAERLELVAKHVAEMQYLKTQNIEQLDNITLSIKVSIFYHLNHIGTKSHGK